MTAQHTPGPWESREIPAMHVIVIAEAGKMHPHASAAKWTDACEGPHPIDEQDRANARLIAAAPDANFQEIRLSRFPQPTGGEPKSQSENSNRESGRGIDVVPVVVDESPGSYPKVGDRTDNELRRGGATFWIIVVGFLIVAWWASKRY